MQPHNLSTQLTSFIGREREIVQIKRFLSATRLLTLTGAGGVGKTRLALEVAAEALQDFRDGVWIVDLAPLADPALLPQTIASALSVSEQPGRPMNDTLVGALRDRFMLLVLDNCEHVQQTCARLAGILLRGCPNIRILATSREPLDVPGETLWRVPSMSSPNPARIASLEHLQLYEAVRLFVERARAGQPEFVLTAGNAHALVQICHRLDGIPLAIELAAARTRVLAVEQIAARLDDRFGLLTGGSSSALPRHQTLRATMDWSYGLLADHEQRLLRRLSVFAGGWTLEAAEAVCAGGGVEATHVLDQLTSLVDKSLVIAVIESREARYRLLETMRQYGREKLQDAGEAVAMRQRHRDWCLALAERAAPELGGPQQLVWFKRLEAEHDNLRAALEWSKAQRDGAAACLRLTGVLRGFWARRGYWREGTQWLDTALARSTEAPASASTGPLLGAAHFARRRGDYGLAASLAQRGLAHCRAAGDAEGGASFLNALGIVALLQGDYERAAALFEETRSLSSERGNKSLLGTALVHLGVVAHYQGHYERAAALSSEGLALFREIGDEWNIAFALSRLGAVALRQSDHQRASALFRDSLVVCENIGNRWIAEECLEGLARAGSATGHHHRAARLFGAAEALREGLGHYRSPADQAHHDESVASTRSSLGTATFDIASIEGRAMTLEQAAAYAFASTEAVPRIVNTTPGLLTAREREVAALVSQGLTNRQIAARLVVTERTAETHVQNILNKLGFRCRAQVAAWAAAQGLSSPTRQ